MMLKGVKLSAQCLSRAPDLRVDQSDQITGRLYCPSPPVNVPHSGDQYSILQYIKNAQAQCSTYAPSEQQCILGNFQKCSFLADRKKLFNQ